jgi:hypothetical protein
MCCDTCPRYMNCENEGSLSDLCCETCPDYAACHKESEPEGDELDEIGA